MAIEKASNSSSLGGRRMYNQLYSGANLDHVAFPLGGIGAGMVCIEGTGKLSHVSLRHAPEIFNEPLAFSTLHVRGLQNGTRILEGPVPDWKVFFPWAPTQRGSAGNGGGGKDYGLPRLSQSKFTSRFPFGTVSLSDETFPIEVTVTGWSPFIPGNSYDSSLPCAAVEYTFRNVSAKKIDAVYSFSSTNFMAIGNGGGSVREIDRGFVLDQAASQGKEWEKGSFCAVLDVERVKANYRLFRGGWFDPLTILWKDLENGTIKENPSVSDGEPSPGASLSADLELEPGGECTIPLLLSWYVPSSNLRSGKGKDDCKSDGSESPTSGCCCGAADSGHCYKPWYATQFDSVEDVNSYWLLKHAVLRQESEQFRDAFYDMTLPDEVVEAVAANLTILKSPTVLRQHDGRIWAWEGCCDTVGCCPGSCTHVWNYAQALPHLFPDLERSLRQTEFNETQDEQGRQSFRSTLPIRPAELEMLPAADGQLGGIIKVFREWRISGDTEWLKDIWDKVRQSMDYSIMNWDPDHTGLLVEPQHNTYDIEFWGPNGMCSSFYHAALAAAIEMGNAVGGSVDLFKSLIEKGRRKLESELYDGEYFVQSVQWEGLRAPDPRKVQSHLKTRYSSEEAIELLEKEGPKYQYGTGCLSDGVLGFWMARTSGLDEPVDPVKLKSHLESVYRYNFREDLTLHANPQRPTYALGSEAGLLLCTWPKGGKPSLPFVYSDEVWTGIEYQVASHMMMVGLVDEGLAIVRACRDRYDGRTRNPFNEYECGHWYARAMSSYALIQGLTGIRYDRVSRELVIAPTIKGDFKAFLSTATGYGVVGVRNGKPFVDVRSGSIDVGEITYRPFADG